MIGVVTDHPLSIAVLDDEVQMRKALRRLLGSHGHAVELFANGRDLLAAGNSHRFDCILLDLHMPGFSGFDVLESLANRNWHPPVIVITGQDQPGNAERTAKLGASAYLVKPLDEAPLLDAIVRSSGQRGGAALNQGAIARSPAPGQ